MEARRRRIETETTAPLVTETQTNAPRQTNVDKNCNATAAETAPIQSTRRRATSHLESAPERLDNDAAILTTPRSSSDTPHHQHGGHHQRTSSGGKGDGSQSQLQAAPLRKSASGVATLGRLRVVTGGGSNTASVQEVGSPPIMSATTAPVTPDADRPRTRRQNATSATRRNRDASLTQFALIDDENVSQQVCLFFYIIFLFFIYINKIIYDR